MTVLIAGAGLAGLSTAFHLGGRDYRIIEKESRPGGLCRTESCSGFRFDYGGHLLHLRGDFVRGLAARLSGLELVSHRRRASIFSKGTLTPYPFQANTHGLPPETVRDCLVGYIEALTNSLAKPDKPGNYEEWILHAFGKGFAEHFFFPWNRKFWKTDLKNISTEWVGWSIPRPSPREVVEGALGLQRREFGYNAEFLYPPDGIEALPRALAAALARPVETGVELRGVVPAERRALLSNGEETVYERLVSSVPLDRLLAMCRGLPPEVREAAAGLRALSVLCVSLGIKGPPLTDQHWIYMPEPGFSFHRVGVYSNFMDQGQDRSSLYLELTLPGPVDGGAGLEELAVRAVEEFKTTPFFEGGARAVEVIHPMVIPHGYVVYDERRSRALALIMSYLRERGIEPVGRYGRWEYSTMEDAIEQGREVARSLGGED